MTQGRDNLFADYQPRDSGNRRRESEITVVDATAEDVLEIAELTASREGRSADEFVISIKNQIEGDPDRCKLFIAQISGVFVGYGRVSRLSYDLIPTGWYLTGVVVNPEARRCGVGAALTKYRLEWLRSKGKRVYYFANSLNRSTVDLHTHFGFREIDRDISVPGCTFLDGVGVLYKVDLR